MKSRHRRKLSNVKLTKQFHIHYLGMWVFISIALFSLLVLALYRLEVEHWQDVRLPGEDFPGQEALSQSMAVNKLVLLTFVFVNGIVALAVLTAHRIAGPHLALKRTFVRIQEGHLGCRLHFRKYDHLEDVEATFNELMDGLQERIERAEQQKPPDLKVVGQ